MRATTSVSVELVGCTSNPVYVCGTAAATCTGSTNQLKSLKSAMASGHDSVLEHASYTFLVSGVSRVCTHQLVRHRVASYSQRSQRYVDDTTPDGICIPPSIQEDDAALGAYMELIYKAEETYGALRDYGISKEDARFALPQGAYTEIVVTMNARELKHFFALRCCNRAQWEIREVAEKMLAICKRNCPEIFEGMGPSCVQLGYCPEGKGCCGRSKPLLPGAERDERV